jgi:hypothetical protein
VSTNPYAVPPYEQPQQPEPYAGPRQGGRAVPRVISALAGVLLTPVALGLVIYGGSRLQRMYAQTYSVGDEPVGLFMLIIGGLLLLGVALLGVLSGLGPMLGGLVWGVLPGLAGVLGPRDVLRFVYDVGGRELSVGLVTWMVMGALFGSGFLLIGAGLVGTLTRRRPDRL